MKNLRLLWLAALLPLGACQSDDEEPATGGTLEITFVNEAGGSPFRLDESFENTFGERYTPRDFKYYVSNVKLRDPAATDGPVLFIAPDSYHLINVSAAEHVETIAIKHVAAGEYAEVEFAVGIDNGKNTSLDNVGDLDPSNDMAWDWNTGYKFLLLEGSFTAPDTSGNMVFHIGTDANYRIMRFRLANFGLPALRVRAGETTRLTVRADVNAMFAAPNEVRLADLDGAVMFGPTAGRVADNYAEGMFTLEATPE